jgi:hypothetical protein
MFDIEVIPSPTGNNVTLYINGTNRSNNVTVICGNLDTSLQFHNLFTLILEFIGKLINQGWLLNFDTLHMTLFLAILPAPNGVHYIEDPPGYLQILWEPPTSDEFDLQNISIRRDARILHYTIYITTEESTIVQVYNTYFRDIFLL